jgi:transposase InsO family protein
LRGVFVLVAVRFLLGSRVGREIAVTGPGGRRTPTLRAVDRCGVGREQLLEPIETMPWGGEVEGFGVGLDDLEIATCGWIGWFNDERLHGELDDATPAEVEAALLP